MIILKVSLDLSEVLARTSYSSPFPNPIRYWQYFCLTLWVTSKPCFKQLIKKKQVKVIFLFYRTLNFYKQNWNVFFYGGKWGFGPYQVIIGGGGDNCKLCTQTWPLAVLSVVLETKLEQTGKCFTTCTIFPALHRKVLWFFL